MKNSIYRILMIVLCSLNNHPGHSQLSIPLAKNTGTLVQLLNGTWKFKYIPSIDINSDSNFYKADFPINSWKPITVPGHWELQGFAEPKYHRVDTGTGLYINNFDVSESYRDKQMFLAFDGVLYGYDFWINGKYVGAGNSAFNRKSFDVTAFVNVGKKNTLAVKVSTRNKGYEFDTNDDWTISGIFRDVTFMGVPKTHIKDYVIKTYVKNEQTAHIDLSVLLEKSMASPLDNRLSIKGRIYSPFGKLVKQFSAPVSSMASRDTISLVKNVSIEDAQFWTAETPWLYHLELSLLANEKVIQKINQQIGLREISTSNGILKLNGMPIKLKGVDHHDIEPTVGRAFTSELILKDLLLMKKANINFVRTSHYPPHPSLIELCDSLGIYVMCEVPFGYGDEHLNDTTYQDILLSRAYLTVNRDKNHPSIIIWSIGNENPLTPITLKTGQFVKRMDPSRPICYPQIGSYFKTVYKNFPDSIDILAPHYVSPDMMETYANTLSRPIITTEYAHALGLEFDQSETMIDLFYKYPILAGGSVWLFQDQGILRTSDKKIDKDSAATSAWIDATHVYDNFGDQGADGIVYANRVPQTDYWQLRKVYAPVKISSDPIFIKTGTQQVSVKIFNRYDFNDLSTIKCEWMLMADNKIIDKGQIKLKCKPHDSTVIHLPITLPAELTATFFTLNFKCFDQQGYQFTEKNIRLQPLSTLAASKVDLESKITAKPILKQDEHFISMTIGDELFTIDKQTGEVNIMNANTKQHLLNGPFAHVGRKQTLSMIVMRSRDKTGIATNWNPYNLNSKSAEVLVVSPNQIQCKYKFERVESKGEIIDGTIVYTFSDSGSLSVSYQFTPVNATGFLLEAGVGFRIPSSYTEMRWIGDGPYPSYPGKSLLNEFGFFHMSKNDINYQGNHSGVELMTFTDNKGYGFSLKCDADNLAVENSGKEILLSHNAIVSGRYTKFTNPLHLTQVKNVTNYSGYFTIIPIDTNNTQPILKKFFGNLTKQAIPFTPFYHSYDQ